jgi:hypothetical protein
MGMSPPPYTPNNENSIYFKTVETDLGGINRLELKDRGGGFRGEKKSPGITPKDIAQKISREKPM